MADYAAMGALAARLRTTRRVVIEVVRNPGLRRLLLAFLAFNTVEYGSWVAILLYAYEATGPASVGVVALAQLGPAALIAPVTATLGDRYPRGRVLAMGYLLLAGLLGLTATGILVGWDPLLVYAGAVGASMSLTFARPTHNALLPALARTTEELTAANAATSIAEAAGILAGPLGAALILTVAGPGEVLAVLAATMVVGAALVLGSGWRVAPDRAVLATAPEDAGADRPGAGSIPEVVPGALAGFRALAADGDARPIVGILAARTLMIGITDVLFVLVALELFETGESGAAILSAAMGAGGIVGGAAAFLLVGQPRVAPILAACAFTWGAMFAIMGITSAAALAPLLLVIGGTGLAVMDVAGRTLLQRAVRDDVLARVFGVLEGLMMGALAVGSILVSLVVGLVDLQVAVVVFAALLPAAVALTLPGVRAIDRRAIVPVRAIALLRRLRMLEALDPPVMEALARSATFEHAVAGTVVIREGERGDRFYVLEDGAMRVSRADRHIRELDAVGDGFGEIALLRDVPRTATVTAARDSMLLVLERGPFLAAITRSPTVAAETERIAAERLDDRPGPIAWRG
jgi:MFS family permease